MNQIQILLVIISEVIFCVSSITHWAVTDDGKIQSNLNSVFSLKSPYDLLTLLEQEKREEAVQKLYDRLVARKAAIDLQWTQIYLLANIESLIYTSDPNCQIADKEKTSVNLYASIATDGSFRQGITSKDFLLNNDLDNMEMKIPDCENTFPLDFSMLTFEHLQAMKNRKTLTQQQEKDLIQYLAPGMSIETFGSHIAYGLLTNKTSWLHLNLGAIYWRYKGDSYKALECARRAIVTAPKHYRDIPLLTTGGIFHAARHSAEAAIVLHTAINYAPDQSRQHLALGNIYATLGDYKRSTACYDNCLKLSPNMQQARSAKHAVLCHQKIEETLTTLLSKLQEILTDLQTYNKEQEEWLTMTERIFRDKDSQDQYLGFHKDWSSDFVNDPTQTCTPVNENNQILFSCEVTQRSHMLPPNLQIDVNTNLQMLKNIKKQATKINQQIAESKFLFGFNDKSRKKIFEDEEETFELFIEQESEFKSGETAVSEDLESDDWPPDFICKNYSPFKHDLDMYIPIFLSYKHPVLIISDDMVKKHKTKESDLLVCEIAQNSHNYFTSPLLKLLQISTVQHKPDFELMTVLAVLVEQNDLKEIGKRLSLAMQFRSEDSWVVYATVSLYWRVKGKFYDALKCAQASLDSAPSDLKYIPLINIASILQRFKQYDEALIVIKQALNIHPYDPVVNFLYGSLLYIVGNNRDILPYLKWALKSNLHAIDPKIGLVSRTIACSVKFGWSNHWKYI